jgi:hypothetical protein
MVSQSFVTAETDLMPRAARRVYCAVEAPLRLADGTPLHLEWVIEGRDGKLYGVRSELGGWLRRTPYQGDLQGMKEVASEKAEAVMRLTYANTDDPENASVAEQIEGTEGKGPWEQWGDVLERWAY